MITLVCLLAASGGALIGWAAHDHHVRCETLPAPPREFESSRGTDLSPATTRRRYQPGPR